jgi:hypothetical protein
MPNLLPNWSLTLPWGLGEFHLRVAGRLTWATLLFVVGLAFLGALIKPPAVKRPFPTAVGVALFPVILVVGLVLAKAFPSVQRTFVWLTIGALIAHGLAMVTSREPRDPARKATWAECFAGAVATFAMFTLGYAIIPSEWLTYANSGLEWGDNTKFVFMSHQAILGLSFLPNYPFNLDFPALRDVVVSLIYGIILGANLMVFSKWQKRLAVKPVQDADDAPVRRSRFGRPLRAQV